MTGVKICGLSAEGMVDVAIDNGAAFVGFVMVRASPRYVAPDAARRLVDHARGRAKSVLLFADADQVEMDTLVHDLRPDMIQFHGRETLRDLEQAKIDYELPIIRALGVRSPFDLAWADELEDVCDHLLFDAKPPQGADRTGGHGVAFDWSMLSERVFAKPWFLAGGLTPQNAAEAARISGAPLLDVSSGVESAPGVKDAALIAAFLKAVV